MMVADSKRYTRLFSELLPEGTELPSYKDRPIQDVQMDSRKVKSGDLFLAVKGVASDGRKFIKDAIDRGAAAVIAEQGITAADLLALKSDVPVLEVNGLTPKVGEIAAKFFGQPTKKMQVIGITGTNGKTSVSFFLAQALAKLQQPCGVVGTLGWGMASDTANDKLERTINTTPDPVTLQRIFFELASNKSRYVAIEVSSHGLEQERLAGTQFDTALLTNITRDHLDYHGTMEAYAGAKQKLFKWPGVKHAVLNIDDEYGRRFCQEMNEGCEAFTFGTQANASPDLLATDIKMNVDGIQFNLIHKESDPVAVSVPFYGRFNVSNLLAVASVLVLQGFTLAAIKEVLENIAPPAGRMQRFKQAQGPAVIVDYAHTPDALEKLLLSVREHCNANVVCAFGCGGDRDKGKRAEMGAIAAQLSDQIVLTNDNPRSEDPKLIVKDIQSGIPAETKLSIKLDRTIAIRSAIYAAAETDVVVIAGKGHENYQDINGNRMAFSDIEVVRKTLTELQEYH